MGVRRRARLTSGEATRWGRVLVAACLLAVTASGVTAMASKADVATSHNWAAGKPGCDPSRPAVAHHADGQVLANQPSDGPVPCGVSTGLPTMENRIEVTNNNAVI